MSGSPLTRAVRDYADINALLLSRVRDDPCPYAARGSIAGIAISALLERAGNPQRQLRFLHVAGSKGKGSVALLAEQLLRSAGEATGTYTSPHLRRWNERVRVNGAAVDDATLAAALESLRGHLVRLDATDSALAPSFFDVVTAAAIVAFARAGCRTVVLETGLGGLYDATNVISPAACCITSIELEHTDKLGNTLAEIARHKAGIIKPGAPVVTGRLPPEARSAVAARIQATQSRELRLDHDWHLHSTAVGDGLARDVVYRETWSATGYEAIFRIHHPAEHMAVNAGLALALVRAAGFTPNPSSLASCRLPARAQLLRERPWVMVDGAHTSASLAALHESLDRICASGRHFVVSATRGKSLHALATLMSGAARVWVTRADAMRSADAEEVAKELRALMADTPVQVEADPVAALNQACEALRPDELLCVCGSVYLAGLALDVYQV